MKKIRAWIGAMRLRTLPLSLSGIIVGSALATLLDHGNIKIFLAALCTTICFQVLSNLANDLGDSQKGTDNENRVGPERAVQSGQVSILEMKIGVMIFVLLSFLAAGVLIYFSLPNLTVELIYVYSALALLSVLAAVYYTIGKSAYGYSGLGDVMVFVFFGLVSVLGVFSLYGLSFEWLTLFPAITIGAWSTAVLNLNNMRDVANDGVSGKRTIVVKIGYKRAKLYHVGLLLFGAVSWLIMVSIFILLTYSLWPLLALIPSFFIAGHLKKVFTAPEPSALDGELKKVAFLTFFSSLFFAVALLLV
ncbi:MAG: 1,4-dihydroxy-2-naphthoate octaprenyltransferase [Crocinitomicaceae bacterium]|jgi:1,4-dihydroxy-2-naphthoate octaprenyltransferase|nr:1,4-dihydroxy-2-naphthoate octaprenyltransferase [Crocinitomicaceae bacterium]MDG2504904.1 1,4-dihydroxy-2-naphthoate octaprenyltransferase [Crocinitomicaceae bacterium]